MTKSLLPKSCAGCRAQLIIESKEDVIERRVDGRRILTCVCPACGEVNEFMRKLDSLKIKEQEKWIK